MLTKKRRAVMWCVGGTLGLAAGVWGATASTEAGDAPEPTPVEVVREGARALVPMVESDLAERFLRSAEDLPSIEGTRVMHYNRATRTAYTAEEAEKLGDDALEGFEAREYGEGFYYNTFYGTPTAYCRALDFAAEAGFESADGAAVADFGFGGIGQLRMLASLGARVVGIDVSELTAKFYTEPGDTGPIARGGAAEPGPAGSVRLVTGRYPSTDEIVDEVGGGFDLFMSKNTLKRGYIHPAREVDARMLIDLGADDERFVRSVYEALRPGGVFVIYNLCPKEAAEDEPYIPWADGRCPFERALCERVGFEVVAFNEDDSEGAREMAGLLGWGEAAELEEGLFAWVTVMRKPVR